MAKNESEHTISKGNRRKTQAAAKSAIIYHRPLPYVDRSPSRRQKDKKIAKAIKKARKRAR
ncbi:hypothetical protein CMO96_03620 [Candidatus Woesebacteria bacterium]|nr:hypothetical protein [Candidatus Woesebacteria bacterium]